MQDQETRAQSSRDHNKTLKFYVWLLVAFWTVAVSGSLLWNLFQLRQGMEEAARTQARAAFDKDILYRRWNAMQGGVYAPVSEQTPPNPHLDVAEREIETPSGRQLTLINPAYMTRQVHELGEETHGVQGHITSLNPIRPENQADAWETQALQTFERGATEASTVAEIKGVSYMRLMRPLMTEAGCLKCHAKQGYQQGDVRGGISVSVPTASLWAITRGQMTDLGIVHGALWLLGVLGIGLGTRRIGQADALLRESEEKFRCVVTQLPNGIVLTDERGRVIEWNHSQEQISGISAAEAQGQALWELETRMAPTEGRPPAFGEQARAVVQEITATGQVPQAIQSREQEIQWADGALRHTQVDVFSIQVEHGFMIGNVLVDITERKRAAVALQQARDQALEASQFKTQLLATVSHELHTPLNAILGYSELLQEGTFGDVSAKQHEVLDRVMHSTHYLTGMVNQLLDQARLDAGKIKLNIAPFDPQEMIRQVESKVNVLASSKGLTLSTEVAAGVPATLSGDEQRLQQILINLVGNAVKFTPAGAVQVRIYCPDADHWAISVSDTGPGIPPEMQEKIFEPFRRVDGSATRQHHGVGLGLSIVKRFTALMGGKIALESELGQGSTFSVLLPLIPQEDIT